MSAGTMHVDEIQTDVTPVRRLIAAQFPQWAGLPITPAVPQGWDNRTFRLAADMSVCLPSAQGYTPQVEKEHRWLPFLAPHLPLPIPVPLALGMPAEGFPWNWSIYCWLEGDSASSERTDDMNALATTLAHFLAALQQVDRAGGPPPGLYSAFRGGPLTTYDAETRRTIVALGDEIDAEAATAVWKVALAARWQGTHVWFHGDVAVGNLVVSDGRLSAVIDFGRAGVGDPACDVTIAWTRFGGESRAVFRPALPVDGATWVWGRGWALWKALLVRVQERTTNPTKAAEARDVIDAVLADNTDAA